MFRRNHAALFALVMLILISLMSIFGPGLYGRDPFEMVWAPFTRPGENWDFILGTDYLGRDLLAMIITGLVSMTMSGQFIGMERVELPYYLVAIGLSAVKVALLEQEEALGKLGGLAEDGVTEPRPALTVA